MAMNMDDAFVLQAVRGNIEEIERRIRRGQSVDVRHQRLKYAAIHGAADHGHLETLHLLVEYGADVNLRRTVRVGVAGGCRSAAVGLTVSTFPFVGCSSGTTRHSISRRPVAKSMSSSTCSTTAPNETRTID